MDDKSLFLRNGVLRVFMAKAKAAVTRSDLITRTPSSIASADTFLSVLMFYFLGVKSVCLNSYYGYFY